MDPNVYLKAVAPQGEGVICVDSRANSTSIRFIGTSLNSSLRTGEMVDNFIVNVPKGQEGIVAVAVFVSGKNNYDWYGFLLSVKDGHIDLETPWLPNAERIGHVSEGRLVVRIKDKYYCTDVTYARNTASTLYVPDGNLLCRYLIGTAEVSDVIAAAEEVKAEESARAKLTKLEADLKEADNLRKNIEDILRGYKRLWILANNLAETVRKPWHKRGKISDAISTFHGGASKNKMLVEAIAKKQGFSIEE